MDRTSTGERGVSVSKLDATSAHIHHQQTVCRVVQQDQGGEEWPEERGECTHLLHDWFHDVCVELLLGRVWTKDLIKFKGLVSTENLVQFVESFVMASGRGRAANEWPCHVSGVPRTLAMHGQFTEEPSTGYPRVLDS